MISVLTIMRLKMSNLEKLDEGYLVCHRHYILPLDAIQRQAGQNRVSLNHLYSTTLVYIGEKKEHELNVFYWMGGKGGFWNFYCTK